jgi:hypothetical protein
VVAATARPYDRAIDGTAIELPETPSQFTWNGSDDDDPAGGRGWEALVTDGSLLGPTGFPPRRRLGVPGCAGGGNETDLVR